MTAPALFEARFISFCRSCGDNIDEGDEVGFLPDVFGIQCAGCWEAGMADPAYHDIDEA